jgi:hypothetical protein
MADDVWARPRIPTGESVAAALRLAKKLKPDACVLYDGDDGATELIVHQGGRVFRHVLYASGATEQTEVHEPLPRYRLSRKLIYAGLICLPLIVGAGFVFKPENSTLWIGGPLAIVIALFWAAALVQKHHDLDALVPAGAAAAPIPYDLGGWEPKTAAQLRAVCDLCKAGDGYAYLLERSRGGVEVETIHKLERHRHLLDLRGIVIEKDVAAWSRGAVWTSRVAALAWVIPLFALLYFDRWLYFLVGVGVCFLIGAAASRFKPRRRRSLPGERRFTVQMEAPSD